MPCVCIHVQRYECHKRFECAYYAAHRCSLAGFYVNRSLSPWATEALALVQGGIAPDALDAAVRKFGYPIGPGV